MAEIPAPGFLSSIRLALSETGGRDPFAELRELHNPTTSWSGKKQCAHCAELCHSRSGLGCEDVDAEWPCPTIEILDAIAGADAPVTAITEVIEGGWYRSLLPSGELWCESSDRDDIRRQGPNGVPLTRQMMVTTIAKTWIPYEVADDE